MCIEEQSLLRKRYFLKSRATSYRDNAWLKIGGYCSQKCLLARRLSQQLRVQLVGYDVTTEMYKSGL